jgi:hypothetical protein
VGDTVRRERSAQCQSRLGSCRGDGDGLTLQRWMHAWVLPAMTLDKVLARPLEPDLRGSKTKQDKIRRRWQGRGCQAREREAVVSRGWYYCVCGVVCLGR